MVVVFIRGGHEGCGLAAPYARRGISVTPVRPGEQSPTEVARPAVKRNFGPLEHMLLHPVGWWSLAVGLVALGCSGCDRQAPAPAPHYAASVAEQGAGPGEVRQLWEVLTLAGTPVGHAQTTLRPVLRDGQRLVSIEGLQRMTTLREGTPVTLEVRFSSLEMPDGRLVEFESTTPALRLAGRTAGNQLLVETSGTGRSERTTQPWSPQYRGFLGVQQSLWESPMQPGQSRTVVCLDPTTGQPARTQLAARDYEGVRLLHGTRKLLRIDTRTTLAGQTLVGALWADPAGEILKTWTDLLDIESYRTEPAEAQSASARAVASVATLDMIRSIAIPVARRLDRPLQTRRLRYRVRLEGHDPAEVFPSDGCQRVRRLDARSAEITVVARRLGEMPASGPPDLPPSEADSKPSHFVQSDDLRIVAAAERAAAGQADAAQAALRLERFVFEAIAQKDYRQAFDSAVDALATGRGDCTEHAVLLAALARARGIPARAAIGLVYVDGAFLYHMWTEVYVAGRWFGLDATRAAGGTSAAYLKIAHTSLESTTAYASLLPVARVAGKLSIEILEAQ